MQSKPSTPEARIPKAWPFRKVFYGWAIVSAGFIASFGSVPMFGPVLGVFFDPIQDELGWNRATLAFAFTLGSMTSAASTIAFGRVLDSYGSRVIVVIAGAVIALSMVGISFMQVPWQFWILFGLGRGSALGGIQIGVGISIANWFIKRRPRALGIHQAGLRAGQALVPLLILGMLAFTGWREAWRLLAVFAAITIIVPGAVYLRRRPEDLGLHPDDEKPANETSDGPRGIDRDVRDVSWTLVEARRTRAFWMIIMFISMDRFALGAVNLHMVINFQDKGLGDAQAISILSLFAATSALTSAPWGFVLEWFHIRYSAMLVSLLLGLSMGVLLMADNYPLAVVFGLSFGLAVGGASLVEELLWPDYFGRAHLGAIRAFSAPFRFITPFGATMAGFIHDWTDSYSLAFTIFAGVFFATLLSMAFATPPRKRPPVGVVEGTEGVR